MSKIGMPASRRAPWRRQAHLYIAYSSSKADTEQAAYVRGR
jgi:hypothetical protein